MENFISQIVELFTTEQYLEALSYGFLTTIEIAFAAIIIGLALGVLVVLVEIAKPSPWMVIPKFLARAYTTIIRGTPMALQLFIMFYVIFAFRGFPEIITAILAFGINSGAYVAESIRAGVQSVDKGQIEAGMALGLPRRVILTRIIAPQAIKNCIPSIGNEIISLIKETAIVSMIGMFDLTMAAKDIGSGNNMANYLVPMVVVALFYLIIVLFITFIIKKIEKRLKQSDSYQKS